MAVITHVVITTGTQINSPVMKYFFTTIVEMLVAQLPDAVALEALGALGVVLTELDAPVGAGDTPSVLVLADSVLPPLESALLSD